MLLATFLSEITRCCVIIYCNDPTVCFSQNDGVHVLIFNRYIFGNSVNWRVPMDVYIYWIRSSILVTIPCRLLKLLQSQNPSP